MNDVDDHLHLGDKMRWGYKTYAIDPLIEDCGDLGDNLREAAIVCWLYLTINREVRGYLVVLAVDALEVAVREKDVAYP